MTNEQVAMTNILPEIIPHFILRSAFDFSQVGTNFDMTSVNEFSTWIDFLQRFDQRRLLNNLSRVKTVSLSREPVKQIVNG